MKIKELLTDETKWTQHAYAKTRNGYSVYPLDPTAVCWCLIGAMHKCYSEWKDFVSIANKINEYKKGINIIDFNDNATYEEVIALVNALDI